MDNTIGPLWSMFDLLGVPGGDEAEVQPEPEYLLCPSTIPIFTLEEQRWMNVCVDQIYDADWSSDAFERLVLPEERKNRLQSLTASHSSYKEKRSSDMIKGKGKGLVMLFYGPSGVGKTLTAGKWHIQVDAA